MEEDHGFADLDKVLAVLKLSTKYQVDHMRYHALRLLHAGYVPLTLEELDDSTIRKNEASLSGALSIIPVARQCNALWLLPSAFYLACALDKGKWHEFEELQDAALDITEERLILRGRARLMYINNLLVCQPLRKLCENEHEYCEQAKLILLSTWTDAPPLRDVEDLSDTNLCSLCLPRVDLGVEIGRSSVWDLLPAMFNLPSWEELKKQQAIDLGYSTNSSMVSIMLGSGVADVERESMANHSYLDIDRTPKNRVDMTKLTGSAQNLRSEAICVSSLQLHIHRIRALLAGGLAVVQY